MTKIFHFVIYDKSGVGDYMSLFRNYLQGGDIGKLFREIICEFENKGRIRKDNLGIYK